MTGEAGRCAVVPAGIWMAPVPLKLKDPAVTLPLTVKFPVMVSGTINAAADDVKVPTMEPPA